MQHQYINAPTSSYMKMMISFDKSDIKAMTLHEAIFIDEL